MNLKEKENGKNEKHFHKIDERRSKMEAKTILLGVVLMALLAMPLAIAQETEADLQGDPGITPDSAMYGLKLGWEKIQLGLTFNQEKKAEMELEFAQKRLLEAKKMAEKGDLKAMEKAEREHGKLIEKARERISRMDGDGREKSINESMTKLVGLQRAIEVHEQRIEVLKDILSEKNMTDEQRVKFEALIDKMQNNTAKLLNLEEKKKDNFKTKLKAVTNKSDEEIENVVEDIEKGQGLDAARKLIAEKRINQTEKALEKLKSRLEDVKKNGLNVSFFDERIILIESTLAEAKSLYAGENYTAALETLKPVSNFGRNLSEVVHKMGSGDKQERIAELAKEAKEKNADVETKVRGKAAEAREKANVTPEEDENSTSTED